MHRSTVLGWMICVSVVVATSAAAQGVQTATITGIVTSIDGQPLPGVEVTAMSPAL